MTLSIMILHNDTMHNDTKLNDTKLNGTEHIDIWQNDIKHYNPQYNDAKNKDTYFNLPAFANLYLFDCDYQKNCNFIVLQ